jgi:hypothetical protein
MQFHRNEYLDLMAFGHFERQMFVELFGPMVGLEDEWRRQGASQEELDLTAFDWDFVPVVQCGATTGVFGGPPPRTLEETPDYVICQDELGRRTKLYKSVASIALPLTHPVHDFDSWMAVKHLFTFREERIDVNALEQAKKLQARGALVIASIPGGFDTPRQLMGEETACTAYYEQPELMQDIIETCSNTSLKVLERVTDHLLIDQLSVHEDLAGKPGPLIGPLQIRQFIQPYYRPVWDLVHSRGTTIFDMDSDGNVNSVIDAFLECGLNSMHPMEPAAGMDIVSLRQKYGDRLKIRGGIDKHVLRAGKEAIRDELTYKLQPAMQQGGVAFGLDHRIPNGTPLDGYRYYVDLGRELLGLPPREGGCKGWKRMSF